METAGGVSCLYEGAEIVDGPMACLGRDDLHDGRADAIVVESYELFLAQARLCILGVKAGEEDPREMPTPHGAQGAIWNLAERDVSIRLLCGIGDNRKDEQKMMRGMFS